MLLTLLWLPTPRTTLGFPILLALRCPVSLRGLILEPALSLMRPMLHNLCRLSLQVLWPLCPQAWCSLLPYCMSCPSRARGESAQVASGQERHRAIFSGVTSERSCSCSSGCQSVCTCLPYRPCPSLSFRQDKASALHPSQQTFPGMQRMERDTCSALGQGAQALAQERVSKKLIWPSADRHAGLRPGDFPG